MNAFEQIESWWFNVNDETWILRGQGDRGYLMDENAQLHFENDEWTMDDVGAELIDGLRPAGTAAAIVAYLNEHGVPWDQTPWSSTPPTRGDMLARHPNLEDSLTVMTWNPTDGGGWWQVNMPRCISSGQFVEASTDTTLVLSIGQACDHRHYTKTGSRSVEGMVANGWVFRPLTSVESS